MEKEPQDEEVRREPLPGDYGFPIPKELFFRELGFVGCFSYFNNPRNNGSKNPVTQALSTKAVNTLCTKELTRRKFNLPTGARTTFHIAFSADGTKVASCHGDHNVYVCDVASGEVMQTLSGHPRTPWCVVFHPTQNDVLASGCLAGQVRVWDLKGGSEVLSTDSGTVIASLAFHPTVRLLAIATFNEIIFWDWNHPYPMARCSTENTKEKVRLVRFDRFGHSLITGITNFPGPPVREDAQSSAHCGVNRNRPNSPQALFSARHRERRLQMQSADPLGFALPDRAVEEDLAQITMGRSEESAAFAAGISVNDDDNLRLNARQDRFQESYRQLVSHYEELVSNYQQFLQSRIPRLYDMPGISSTNPPTLAQNIAEIEPNIALSESQIDPILEEVTAAAVAEDIMETEDQPIVVLDTVADNRIPDSSSNNVETSTSPSQLVIDDEVPGPSRLLLGPSQNASVNVPKAAISSSSTIENRPSDVLQPSSSSSSSTSSSESTTPSSEEPSPRTDNDLQSIEALAQNILEMQNLCSQVRMDAPIAVENQHIMELRVIRRHLELLQEQTRDLQSSIRQTLNSLATNSLAALRSHVANATNNSSLGGSIPSTSSRDESPTNPFPNSYQPRLSTVAPPTTIDYESYVSPSQTSGLRAPLSRHDSLSEHSRRSRNDNQHPSHSRAPASSNREPSSTFYRIMIAATPYSESGRVPNSLVYNRIRLPPMVDAPYDVPESIPRSSSGESPGPSRSTNSNNPNNSNSSTNNSSNNSSTVTGPRRIVREFHLVSGRPSTLLSAEHSRYCPFSTREPFQWRPPPRMRTLYDMGEMPPLVTWPTMETGTGINCRDLQPISTSTLSRQNRNLVSNITITLRSGHGTMGSPFNNNNRNDINISTSNDIISQFINYNQWLLSSGITTTDVSSDVLVGIYLTVRQLNNNTNASNNISSSTDGNSEFQSNEQWQRMFRSITPGVAIIPSTLRQGQQHNHSDRLPGSRRRIYRISHSHNQIGIHSVQPDRAPVNLTERRVRTNSINAHASNCPLNTNSNSSSNSNPGSSSNSSSTLSRLRTLARVAVSMASEESSSSSSSSSSSPGPSSNVVTSTNVSAETQAPVKKESTSSSSSKSVSSSSTSSQPSRSLPIQLARNFSRIFFIRTSDELIPVYSTNVSSSEAGLGSTEIRELLQANVYFFPIGLFLDGQWESNAQTIGIHWPPLTREEEYAMLDLRMSGRPIEVYETDTRESFPSNRSYPRIRIDYDRTSLRVNLPSGFTLHFIQSGLTLLDCISTSINLPRPRAAEGTFWIDYFGPFLDIIERMFGLRHARRTPSSHHRMGAFFRRAASSSQDSGRQFPQASSSGSSVPSSSSNSNSNATSTSSRERVAAAALANSNRRGELTERIRTRRRIITLAGDAPSYDSSRRAVYEDNFPNDSNNDSNNSTASGAGTSRGSDLRIFFRHRHHHHHHHHHRQEHVHPYGPVSLSHVRRSNFSSSGSNVEGDGSNRLIRLAVDAAASEVLRRNQNNPNNDNYSEREIRSPHDFSGIPVESRIERVLNERGNRGFLPPSMPMDLLDAEHASRRMRLEEIQLRISSLSQWARSRPMTSSGTQTQSSFVREGWQPRRQRESEEPSTSTSESQGRGSFARGGLSESSRISRRRPYSRIARVLLTNESDSSGNDEGLPATPARVPRLSTQDNPTISSPSETSDNANAGSRLSSRVDGEGDRASVRRINTDNWNARTGSTSTGSAHLHHFRPVSSSELAGSARTRAHRHHQAQSRPLSYNVTGRSEPQRPQIHTQRGGSDRGVGRDLNQDEISHRYRTEREEPHVDAGARFYPGYIPEILITPRTRPPTYYTMDAATTAFLSSRIQKWDFTEFLIPDISKREEFLVVSECSLHSDACLDIAADSDFLAVLQPSESGAYNSVGIYSLRDQSLGDLLNVFHLDQNTVSVSISPSCDFLLVGYAGRGPLYRFVHPSRNIGKIISILRDEEDGLKLVNVKDLYADSQVAFMSINCMHWVPVPGYGIIYGTNTGDLVLLS